MIYESVVTAALSASLVSLILLDAASIQQIVDKLRLFAFGALLMVFGRDKRWSSSARDRHPEITQLAQQRVKTIYFVRHGESEWNLIFNKGSKLLLPFKALAALVKETSLFARLDPDSVLYDSPLNQQGLEQAQEIAAWLRENPDALPRDALVVSSNLRRALQTAVVALQDRLLRTEDVVHVHSSLQEISTNVDTVSILPPNALPTLPRIPDLLQAPATFDVSRNRGNKPLRGNGRQRIDEFCRFAFDHVRESNIIVACHSLWARFFFRELLAGDSVAKRLKIANGGIVSCDLVQGIVGNKTYFVVDPLSVKVVYKGFESKTKEATGSKKNEPTSNHSSTRTTGKPAKTTKTFREPLVSSSGKDDTIRKRRAAKVAA